MYTKGTGGCLVWRGIDEGVRVGRLMTRSVSGDRFSATCDSPSVDQDYYLHQNFASGALLILVTV